MVFLILLACHCFQTHPEERARKYTYAYELLYTHIAVFSIYLFMYVFIIVSMYNSYVSLYLLM